MRLSSWITRFQGLRTVVFGDLCLDEYIVGKAQRLSREAPVPVLELSRRFHIAGAACNPAINVQAVGGFAVVVGVVGDDGPGEALKRALVEAGIDVSGVVTEPGRPTTVKTRVLAEHLFPQQVVRVDRVDHRSLAPATRAALRRRLAELVPGADAVLLSDYRISAVEAPLVRTVLDLARGGRALVAVDSQGAFTKFRGSSLFRCNKEEAEGFLGRSLDGDPAFVQAGRDLQKRLMVTRVAITRGSEGMSVVEEAGEGRHIPASNPSEVYDVTGAGDTVIAVLTLALAAGAPLLDAARLANLAAGEVVKKLGNATVSRDELERIADEVSDREEHPFPPNRENH